MATAPQGRAMMTPPIASHCPQTPPIPTAAHNTVPPPWVHDIFIQFNMINSRMQDIQNRLDGLNNLEQFVNGIKHELHGINNSIQGVMCQTSNMDKRLHAVELIKLKQMRI